MFSETGNRANSETFHSAVSTDGADAEDHTPAASTDVSNEDRAINGGSPGGTSTQSNPVIHSKKPLDPSHNDQGAAINTGNIGGTAAPKKSAIRRVNGAAATQTLTHVLKNPESSFSGKNIVENSDDESSSEDDDESTDNESNDEDDDEEEEDETTKLYVHP